MCPCWGNTVQFASFTEIGPTLGCEESCLDSECRLEKHKLKFRIFLILGCNSFNGFWTHFIRGTEGTFIAYTGPIKMKTKAKF